VRVGSGNHFHVPVRNGGRGSLIIGAKNCFGYLPAHRLGSGEILLQPRDAEAEIIIGEGNSLSNNVSIIAMGRIVIGDQCLIGDLVAIFDCDFHEIDPMNRKRSAGPVLPVQIGNNVWIGSRAVILKGVTIGDNSVIGAMSVVTKPVPPNSIAAGNPAKVISQIPDEPEGIRAK
jgi:maltose O-acetyltransferase